MRHMLVHAVARLMVLEKGIPAHWDKALRKNGQLAVDIIRAIQDWRLEDELIPDAREEPELGEELVDVEEETQALDAQAEQEIEHDGDDEEVEEVEDDSEATFVDSPTVEAKRPEALREGKKAAGKMASSKDLSKDFQKFSLGAVPNGLSTGDYGTLA